MKRLFLCVISLFALSCDKPSLIEEKSEYGKPTLNSTEISIVNGVFAFKSVEDFEAAAKQIGSLSSEAYDQWQKKYGINTLYSTYLDISLDVSLEKISKHHPQLIFFNEKSNAFELNSVNSNYAKISNSKGMVIIGNAIYQISAKEIKCMNGTDPETINILLSAQPSEYKAKGVTFSKVEEGFKPRNNAKMGPWEKEQKGNDIRDMAGWDGAYYLKAIVRCRYYWIPNPNPIFPGMDIGKMSVELEAKYYRERGILKDQQQTPQQYSVTWAFELSDGMNFGTYIPYNGTSAESGIQTFSRVFYDGYPCDVRNLNIPVTAMDFNKNGASVTSTTTFVITN